MQQAANSFHATNITARPRLNKLAVCIAALSATAVSFGAQAQAYPAKPIRNIMALAGGAELVARMVGERLNQSMGQPVLIGAQAGAGGAIGADMVARSAPDGYTILLASGSSQVVRPFVAKTPYDPIRDFTPITKVSDTIVVVLTNAQQPFNSLAEVIDYAKKNPGKLSYASSGYGTGQHLAFELIRLQTNTNIVHVPFKGGNEALTALVSNQVPLSTGILATAAANVASGKLKVLASLDSRRYPAIKNVPTAGEVVPGYDAIPNWMGYFGPAKLPDPIVRRLNTEMVKALSDRELQQKAEGVGFVIDSSTPEAFSAELKRAIAVVGKVVKETGIKPE
jgi:tripartite-type tricarboxylate transporter receptor subunit TctC